MELPSLLCCYLFCSDDPEVSMSLILYTCKETDIFNIISLIHWIKFDFEPIFVL
jgi:hypothetical protein